MTDHVAVRAADVQRRTRETQIAVTLDLDGSGQLDLRTGLGFFDHMLSALAFHARWNLKLHSDGDLHVDDHHTVEDCGLALGTAIDLALGDRQGIRRFGDACAPLDEALARCVVDLSGRSFAHVNLRLHREKLGDVSCETLVHFWQSLATTARMTLHLDVLRGANDHHRAESAFKAAALALRHSVGRDAHTDVPSTKGSL
jgi:imidazoleglycerol phosphate dehydratase HisB